MHPSLAQSAAHPVRRESMTVQVEEAAAMDDAGRPLIDEHLFLIGRPLLRQFVSFVRDLSVYADAASTRSLADEWRTGRQEVLCRERDEAGAADQPELLPLPKQLEPLRDRCFEDAIFRNAYDTVPTDIALVELDRMVVYQKHINLAFVKSLRERIGEHPSEDEVFRTCLPYDHSSPPVRWMRSKDNSFVFVSPSNDLRFLGSMLLKPHQIVDYPPPGNLAAAVALGVGFGSNFLMAIQAEGRVVLCNGNHRAFALREMGITHAPCVIQRASSREELLAIASSDLYRDPDAFLRKPRPSMLKDYFDPKLCRTVPCTRRNRQVRVKYDADEMDVPAI